MSDKVIIYREVEKHEGYRYRTGWIGGKRLRVIFDGLVQHPENIPQSVLVSIVREAEDDGRALDRYKSWSDTLLHRLVIVTADDLASAS